MTDSDGSLLRALLPVIVGGLVVFSATTFYTDFWKKPEVILIMPEPNPLYRDTFRFVNVGQSPADNLRITISPDAGNVVNFTMGPHSQNSTLSQEGGRWIIETRKFPVGATVTVNPILKNHSEPAVYFMDIASDQGAKKGTIEVIPVNNTVKNSFIAPPPVPVNIILTLYTIVAAIVIALVYVFVWTMEKSKLRRRDIYLEQVNNEIYLYYRYYTGQEESKNAHLKMLDSLRNRIREEFDEKRIRRSDFEVLESKILEQVKNVNRNSYHDRE